ncbi:MAG: hypothetical protein RIQ60_1675 [Pseudomonadota bacterium]|jgi:tetratricopeptide (TPR) repeat protein
MTRPGVDVAAGDAAAKVFETAVEVDRDDDGHGLSVATAAALNACWASGGAAACRSWLDGQLGEVPGDASADARQLALQLAFARGMASLGGFELANEAYDAAIGLTAEPGPIQLERARLYLFQHDLGAALDCLELAVTWLSEEPGAWLELGEVLLRLDRGAEARDALLQAQAHLDHDAQITAATRLRCDTLLGTAHLRCVQAEPAVQLLSRTVQQHPESAEAWLLLGHAELLLDHDAASLQAYERAIELSPTPSPALLLHHGMACQQLGQWERARERFARIVDDHPSYADARWYLCQVELALGLWSQGWARYGARYTTGALRHRVMPFRPWDGRALPEDTLLILAEEGLGDEILYASCFDAAMARVGHCIIECEPRLEALFRRSFPSASVVGTDRGMDLGWLQGRPTPRWQVSSGELPRLFRPDAASFEPRRAYLQADPARREHWRRRLSETLGPGLKVGVSWRGGTPSTRTRARSLPLEAWRPIVEVPGCGFVSLQYGDTTDDRARWRALYGAPLVDLAEMHADYDETAAVVAALDLVITVCTAVVHLGGALGQRVWVLAPHAPGWRYGAHAADMPWYAQVEVHRRSLDGDWDEICQSIAVKLRELTRSVTLSADSRASPSIQGGNDAGAA